ncbi:MAG: DNA mismatch repair endonuclease MutL [Tissierellia bacterium]|nr:DNA mismatch repair endonuclease MutL [Tissierellia bacterium]
MGIIHLLDNETINKIAAGEVIENPKSIVKELVENSIDAGADEIIIEIKGGGKTLIRITDNGKGIDSVEIEEAFKRHCTSKIQSSNDLESLITLGFRGEALASIAAVSHVEVISRTNDDIYGVKLNIKGGIVSSREDIGCPVGTTITVTNLFFNVPARKKFLKSDASESSNINEIVTSLALSQENISFKYINNNNVLFKTPKTNNIINTISSLYDKELYNSLIEVDYVSDLVKIKGYTTNLNYYRGNRKNQLIFVNNRYIKHKRINYYIEAAYYSLLPKNKYPSCFLKIEISPSLVDVNVHPAKTEVRFQNEELILKEVKNSIYKTLKKNNIIKEIKKENIINENTTNKLNKYKEIFDFKEDKTNINDTIYDNIKLNNINFTKIEFNNDDIHECNDNKNIFDEAINNSTSNIYPYNTIDNIEKKELSIMEKEEIIDNNNEKEYSIFEKETILNNNNIDIIQTTQLNAKNYEQQKFIESEIKNSTKKSIPELSIIGVLMNTYILCENKLNSELYIIDQHAAHERINYEIFLHQYNNREILMQELLVPEVINLSYDDYFFAMSNEEIFNNLGLPIESFGNNAILISAIPILFINSNLKDLFYTILDSLRNLNNSNINLEMGRIIKNACVKSVKAGDKLHTSEIQKLIDDLGKTTNPYTCPHGRPVIIKMSKYEIERMFERIQN